MSSGDLRTVSAPEQVDALIARMTLREKAGQMTQVTLHTLCAADQTSTEAARLDPERVRRGIIEVGVGSVFNVAGRALAADEWREVVGVLQEAASESRLGIPVLFGLDAVHGSGYTLGATLFPQNLSLAASFRPDLVREASRITAIELAECGVAWNFAPVLDVGRTPLWSRMVETFGEDPLVAARLGEAAVLGHGDVEGVASCAKHYIAYSAPATGRDRTTAWIPDELLRDVYLPPFRAAVAAGAQTVMVNSGDVNGVPVHASRRLLEGILRDELGFTGVIVTDWEDVIKLHTLHRVAPTLKEAVRIAIEAGIDMSMTPFDFDFADLLVELVEEGAVSEERVDASVRRILELKDSLGILERPLPDSTDAPTPRERLAVSTEAAMASLVLLENDGILPLKAGARVEFRGNAADSLPAICGPWTFSWQGDDPSLYPETMRSIRASWPRASSINGTQDGAIVLCLNEVPSVEKPGDISDLRLDEAQQQQGRDAVATGRPVIALLCFDRPRLLDSWIDECAAVVWVGRPGPAGGEAIARLLLGDAEPQGRLPFTYPRHAAELVTYDHRTTDRVGRLYGLTSDYKMDGLNPRWRFGHGLSYTTFDLGVPEVRDSGADAQVSITVTNTGQRAGTEVVQAYLTDLYASVAPRVERLADFRSVTVRAGESVEVVLNISAAAFGFHSPDGFVIEPGEFRLRIGHHTQTLTR